jgi:hypothetical protein
VDGCERTVSTDRKQELEARRNFMWKFASQRPKLQMLVQREMKSIIKSTKDNVKWWDSKGLSWVWPWSAFPMLYLPCC